MNNDQTAAARAAYQNSTALVERDGWGIIRVSGSTRQSFLHNQTTADFASAASGQVVPAVVLTSKATIVDWVEALVGDEDIWLITSPERRDVLLNWLPQFIFFMDDVQLIDESAQWALIELVGPQSRLLLTRLQGETAPPQGAHRRVTLAGVAGVHLAATSTLLGDGFTLLVPQPSAQRLRDALHAAGVVPMPPAVWEALRVTQGRPLADRELTESYNPLEAGLWSSVSFRKGCYIGQEVIARLDTYQKLKQQLWGMALEAPVQPGTAVTVQGKAVGTVTSVAETPQGPRALAYIRNKAGGAGLAVEVDGIPAKVVELPLLTRGRSDL